MHIIIKMHVQPSTKWKGIGATFRSQMNAMVKYQGWECVNYQDKSRAKANLIWSLNFIVLFNIAVFSHFFDYQHVYMN